VVQLRELSRAEEDLDAEFRRLASQLRSQAHRLVPEVLALCPGADEPWFWALLQLAPTPAAQRHLTRARLDHLLRAHRIRRWRGADVVARLQGPSFPHAPGVVEAVDAQIRLILPRLEVVHTQRLVCGRHLEQLLQQLPLAARVCERALAAARLDDLAESDVGCRGVRTPLGLGGTVLPSSRSPCFTFRFS
jgi:hypothetical protein